MEWLTILDWLIKSKGLKKLIERICFWCEKSRKKLLSNTEVVIGTYSIPDLKVDIKAKIILIDNIKPDIEIFLDRVSMGRPYCPKCLRPLDILRASWMANGMQIGYKCKECKTKIRKTDSDIYSEIYSLIRRDYDKYWSTYQRKISEMTKGKPMEYRTE